MFDRYYCIKTNCDTWKFEIFEENEPVNLYFLRLKARGNGTFTVCVFKTPLPGQIPTSCWRHVFTFATVHATDADVTFYDGPGMHQDQDQDSLLVKRRHDNHSPGPVIRELVPSSHQRSEFSNTILCIFSGWDQRAREGIPIPDSLGEEATFINICIGNGSLKCHRVLIPKNT